VESNHHCNTLPLRGPAKWLLLTGEVERAVLQGPFWEELREETSGAKQVVLERA